MPNGHTRDGVGEGRLAPSVVTYKGRGSILGVLWCVRFREHIYLRFPIRPVLSMYVSSIHRC